jgi:hypothetical protein
LNAFLFQDHCSALLKAKAWVELLREEYGIVWCLIPSAENVVNRFLVDQEQALWNTFKGAVSRTTGNLTANTFMDSDSNSEFGAVTKRLHESRIGDQERADHVMLLARQQAKAQSSSGVLAEGAQTGDIVAIDVGVAIVLQQ